MSGDVEILDEDTIVIRNFVYDGLGPDAYFVVGTKSRRVNEAEAIPVPYPANNPQVIMDFNDKKIPILKKFSGEEIELQMPEGVNAYDVKWLSVYCREFHTDFGHVKFNPSSIPRN